MNRQIFRGATAGAIYTITSVLAGIIQFRLIVQSLPPDLAGLWLLFVTVGGYVMFFDLGISPTIGREISFCLGVSNLTEEQRVQHISELLVTLWRSFRILALAAGLLCVAIGESFIVLYVSNNKTTVEWAWAVFSIGAALTLLSGTALAGLYGLGDIAAEKIIRCIALLTGLGLTFVALRLNQGIFGLAVAWTTQAVVMGILGWYRLRDLFPQLQTTACKPNWRLARKMVSPSLKLASVQLGAILILQSANPLIALTIGTAYIPAYEAISKIAVTMMTMALLIVNSSSPFLSMAFAAGELDKMLLLLIRNLRLGVGLMVVLASFMAVNGDRIIAVWLGPSAFAGYPVLCVVLAMVLLEVHHVIFATAVMAAGRIVFVWSALASGIINIALAVILVRDYGLLGIAVAIAIAQLLTNNWYAPYVAIRLFRIPLTVLIREVWGPMSLLLSLQLAADALIRKTPLLSAAGPMSLLACCIVSVCLGMGMCWILALRPKERMQVLEYVGDGLSRIKVEHA